MEAATSGTSETTTETIAPASESDASKDATTAATVTVTHRNIAEWHGSELIDRDGERIGKLESVYYDVETEEPQFGTVKEGLFGRRLTFVPLAGMTIGPDSLQVPVTKEQVRDAPDIAADDLSQLDESLLYHHYELNYTPLSTESGRRLARR